MSNSSEEDQDKYENMKQDDINKNIGIKENREKNNVSEEFNMNKKKRYTKDFENNFEILDNNEQLKVNMYSYKPTYLSNKNNNTLSNNLYYNNMRMSKNSNFQYNNNYAIIFSIISL